MRTHALALLLAAFLAGCSGSGGDDDDGPVATIGDDDPTTPAATAPGSTSAATTGPPDYAVELYDNRYDPTALAVPNFQKVTFTNLGTLSHTVTIVKQGDPPGSFLRDQAIQPNTQIDYNFPNDGTYTVYCKYHSQFNEGAGTATGMAMTITV